MAHSIILLLQYVPKKSSARKQNKFYLEFGGFFGVLAFGGLLCFVLFSWCVLSSWSRNYKSGQNSYAGWNVKIPDLTLQQ